MQCQRPPVEAAVPSPASHQGRPEQLAAELCEAFGRDEGVRGNAGPGLGAAALGHTGGYMGVWVWNSRACAGVSTRGCEHTACWPLPPLTLCPV